MESTQDEYESEPRGTGPSISELSTRMRQRVAGSSDLKSMAIRVKQIASPDTKGESDSPGSVAIIITFEADTQAHAEQHANDMVDANPPGSTTCWSSGETSVTCEYTE